MRQKTQWILAAVAVVLLAALVASVAGCNHAAVSNKLSQMESREKIDRTLTPARTTYLTVRRAEPVETAPRAAGTAERRADESQPARYVVQRRGGRLIVRRITTETTETTEPPGPPVSRNGGR